MGRSRHIQNDSDSVTAGRGSSGSRHEGTCPPTEENSSPEKRPAPLKHRGAAADVAGREPSLSDLRRRQHLRGTFELLWPEREVPALGTMAAATARGPRAQQHVRPFRLGPQSPGLTKLS